MKQLLLNRWNRLLYLCLIKICWRIELSSILPLLDKLTLRFEGINSSVLPAQKLIYMYPLNLHVWLVQFASTIGINCFFSRMKNPFNVWLHPQPLTWTKYRYSKLCYVLETRTRCGSLVFGNNGMVFVRPVYCERLKRPTGAWKDPSHPNNRHASIYPDCPLLITFKVYTENNISNRKHFAFILLVC